MMEQGIQTFGVVERMFWEREGRKPVPLNDAETLAATLARMAIRWDLERKTDFRALVHEMTVLMYGTERVTCAHCGDPYITGSRTGKRSHSLYCSDACCKRAFRDKRREENEELA